MVTGLTPAALPINKYFYHTPGFHSAIIYRENTAKPWKHSYSRPWYVPRLAGGGESTTLDGIQFSAHTQDTDTRAFFLLENFQIHLNAISFAD